LLLDLLQQHRQLLLVQHCQHLRAHGQIARHMR
jgi:hypothetical protein